MKIRGETGAYAGRHSCPSCGLSAFGQGGDEIALHQDTRPLR
ncbi:MAG: hypothetical protein QM682_10785 [Paracoccus sp. (in: a-proteobacteria)]